MNWNRGTVSAVVLVPAVLFASGCSDDSGTWAVPPTAWTPAVATPCTAPVAASGIVGGKLVELVDLTSADELAYSPVRLYETPLPKSNATCGSPLAARVSSRVTITARPDSVMCGVLASSQECTLEAMKSQAAHWNSRAPFAVVQFDHQEVVAIEEQETE